MPFEYKIDKQGNIIFCHFTGSLDDQSLLASFSQFYSDPEFEPYTIQCIDYTQVSEVTVTRQGIKDLVTLCEQLGPGKLRGKICIVASDDLMFGYSRMYQMLCETVNQDISVSRTLEEALKLLDLKTETYPFLIGRSQQHKSESQHKGS